MEFWFSGDESWDILCDKQWLYIPDFEHERERTKHTLPAGEFIPHAVTCKGVL